MQRIAAAHGLDPLPKRNSLKSRLCEWEQGAPISPFYVALLARVYHVDDPYSPTTSPAGQRRPATRTYDTPDPDRFTAPTLRGRIVGSLSMSGL